MTGRKPDLSKMRVFGMECYVYMQGAKKLEERGVKGIFVGYDKGSPAFLVYMPSTGKVIKHRIVRFPKGVAKTSGIECTQIQLDSDEPDFAINPRVGDVTPEMVPHETDETEAGAAAQGGADKCDASDDSGRNPRYLMRARKTPINLTDYDLGDEVEDQMMTMID